VALTTREDLRSITMGIGELCVVIISAATTLQWLVTCLALGTFIQS